MSETQFLQNATLDTIIPHASEICLEDALNSLLQESSADSPTPWPLIPQRKLLFFDEQVTAYAILRLSRCSENVLKTYIPRIRVSLEAFAVDSVNADGDGDVGGNTEDGKELIFSGTVHSTDDPLVIVNKVDNDESSDNDIYVIWKSEAFLQRPRTRLQHPSVVFVASATFSPQGHLWGAAEDEYLPALTPASINVFQPLNSDVCGKPMDPYLPASRVLRVIPAPRLEDPLYTVQQSSSNPIRIIPIASARVRYSHADTLTNSHFQVASLDFEVTPFTTYEVILEKAELFLPNGIVESLTKDIGFTPPIKCRARDDITMVYKLTPEYGPGSGSTTAAINSVLNISLRVTILISDDCHPKISMNWRTNVDFSRTSKRSSSGRLSQDLQRSIRPISRHMALDQTLKEQLPESDCAPNRTTYCPEGSRVNISFSGPSNIEMGKSFHWDVFIVNRSRKPKKFGLSAIPLRKRANIRRHNARPSSYVKGKEVAEAVLDENTIYGKQKDTAPYETELLCLSTDIKIGPLPPGTCHSTRLRFLPLAPGPLHLDAVKLVDLTTNECMDIRELPDIIAFPQENSKPK